MLTSSSNNWERLVAAVLKKQLIWELCHQQSRSPSICNTISSDGSSQRILSFSGSDFEPFSVPPSPLLPPSISQGKTTAVSSNTSSRRITRILFSAWYRRRKSKRHDLVQIPAEYPEFRLGQLERYHFHQLRFATDSFSDKNLLGRGGFGTVYKGRLVGGTLVAVKRLTEEWRPPGEFQFLAQSEIISMAKQRNILRLRGFCMTPTERLLVYPYMVNGSLASYLRARPPNVPPLDWRTRKRIARGSAYGLAYLHDYWIIHHDVKAANIFLDEKFEAVVGDIGLAKPKLMDHEDADIGHMAPEYLSTGKTSEKTDVFAYGITLLELITGQSARVAKDDDVMLLDWVKRIFKEKKLETLVDSDLQNNYVEAEVEQLIQIAVLCTQSSAMGRPKMSEVVWLLGGHGLAERWDEWQKVEERPQEVGVARVPISGRIIHPVELPGPRE